MPIPDHPQTGHAEPGPLAPYTRREADLLGRIKDEIGRCLKTTAGERDAARINKSYFNLENADLIPRRPYEDSDAYAYRPKLTSSMTRRAVEILSDHLYSPGPSRRLVDSDAVDEWLSGVYADEAINNLCQQADRFSTLNGTVVLQAAATGDPDRPICLHLWDRDEFEAWAEPGEPRRPFAVCTISRDDEETTYTLWTRLRFDSFRTRRPDDQALGGRTAAWLPELSGANPYGCLPFTFVHYEAPTAGLTACGLGTAIRRTNAAIDVKMSNLAQSVEYYTRPLGFSRNVAVGWAPLLRPGDFTDIPSRGAGNVAGEGEPAPPEVFYLQAELDVTGCWADITNTANQCFEDAGVPLSAVRMDQTTVGSGIQVVCEQAPLLTRAMRRQESYRRYECDLAVVILRVGAAWYGRPDLLVCADDLNLTIIWPEPRIPIPGPDRDDADRAEVEDGYASKTEVLMRRRSLTREQAVEQLEQVAKDAAEERRIAEEFGPPPIVPRPLGVPPIADPTLSAADPDDPAAALVGKAGAVASETEK